MHDSNSYDTIIIGGGFFGLTIAQYCHDNLKQKRVLVLEKESDFMRRASYNNQARVHGGYHYPRSLLTALRSQVNFDRFVSDNSKAIVNDFDAYYAIARNFSKVTAKQFKLFCERINAPIGSAPQFIKDKFNDRLIEDVFKVKEYVFDADILKKTLTDKLTSNGVTLKSSEVVHRVVKHPDGVSVECESGKRYHAKNVFNCTYSMINKINLQSGLPKIPLKHELTEMCLISLPKGLANTSVTVMCGPFFSFMPFPARGLHTLSHVSYTPHHDWQDDDKDYQDGHKLLAEEARPANHFQQMYKDAIRYIPELKDAKYVDSLWEIKTVLPQSENDDSRPILFKKDHGLKGYTCIMGGKLDNIYDVLREIELIYE